MGKDKDLSIEIYHRIYRLAVRKVPTDQIAITLDLPINVVKNVVEHFFSSKNKNVKPVVKKKTIKKKQTYLDIYVLQRMRFSVIDINGMVIKEHNDYLKKELDKVLQSTLRTVALLMSKVKAVDETGLSTLLDFYKAFRAKGRYTAILDPSLETEAFITDKELESKLPVFGTEKAFEDGALETKKKK